MARGRRRPAASAARGLPVADRGGSRRARRTWRPSASGLWTPRSGKQGWRSACRCTRASSSAGRSRPSRLTLDGERRVPGPEGTETVAASVTARDMHLRASAGLLLVLVGANARALPSLRLGALVAARLRLVRRDDRRGPASGARPIAFRRPTLVSAGLAWRAARPLELRRAGRRRSSTARSWRRLERNIGEAALGFSSPSTWSRGSAASSRLRSWCGCGIVRLRGGLHYRSAGTLRLRGRGPDLRRTFAAGEWQTVATLGASFFAEHFGNALRLDIDSRDVFEGPGALVRHRVEVLSAMARGRWTGARAARLAPLLVLLAAARRAPPRPRPTSFQQVARGLPARARPGRRGAARLPRRLGLRRGLLGVGRARAGRDRRADRQPHACSRTSCSSWGTTSTGAAAPTCTRPASTTSTTGSSATARRTSRSATTTSRAAARSSRDERWESCLQELRTASTADSKARYMRQGIAEDEAAAQGGGGHGGRERRRAGGGGAPHARAANCLPGDATAYEDPSAGQKTLQRGGGPRARAVRLRKRRARAIPRPPAAALLQHPLAAAQAHAGGEKADRGGPPADVRSWT